MEKSFVIGEHLIFTPKANTLNYMDTDEEALILGENESRLLLCFVLNNSRTLLRNQLIDYVWADRNVIVDARIQLRSATLANIKRPTPFL